MAATVPRQSRRCISVIQVAAQQRRQFVQLSSSTSSTSSVAASASTATSNSTAQQRQHLSLHHNTPSPTKPNQLTSMTKYKNSPMYNSQQLPAAKQLTTSAVQHAEPRHAQNEGLKLGQFVHMEKVDPIIKDILDPTVWVHPRKMFYALLNCINPSIQETPAVKYNTAVRIWKAFEQRKKNYHGLRKLGKSGGELHNIHWSSDMYEALIRVHLATSHPMNLQEMMADIEAKQIPYTPMIQQLLCRKSATAGESPKVVQAMMNELSDDGFTWDNQERSLVTAACKRHEFETAFQVIEDLKTEGKEIDVAIPYSIMAHARNMGKSELMIKAILVLGTIEKKYKTLRYYSFALHGFGVAGQFENMLQIAKEREKGGFGMPVEREMAFFTTCFKGDFEDAAEVAAQYIAENELPRVETIECILAAYKLRANPRRTLELLVFLDEVGWEELANHRRVWMPVMQMFAENGAADGAVKFLQHLNAGGDGYDEMQVQYAYKALANSKHVPNNKLKSNPVTVKQLEKDWYAQRQAISTVNQILEEGQTKIRRKLIARNAIDPKEKTKMYSRAVWESMVPAVYFHPKATTTRQNQVHQNQINQAKMGWKRDDAAMTAELWACANDLRYYIPALRVSHDTIVRDAKRAMAKAQERKQIPSEMMEALLEVRLQLGQTHEQVFRYLETRQQQDSTPTAIWNVYRPIVENLLETNDIETLFAMYDTLTKRQVNFLPSSFVPVFEKFAETGDLDNALRLLLMAREKDVPITEKMVLLLIKTCCEAGGTRGLQGVNSLVAGKRSYDPLGQRTWASIIKNCEQTFGEEAALDIYAQLLEGFHVRFSFADAMEVSAEETAEFEQKEFVPPAMEKAVPRGVTGGSLAGYVKTLKEGVKHHTKQSLHQEVEDMLEQCQLTEIVDINHCVDVLTKHAGGKNLTPYVTSSLLDLYVQNSMNNNGDFEQLNAFAERIPLRAAHVDVVLQHLTNLAARDDNIKQIVDNFIEKTSSTYPGGKFDKLGSHLRAFQYYSATRNPVGCKEQFGHLEQHQMNPKKFAILISEYVATLIVNRDFKFISQIFDTHLASGNVKFTDGQLADFATRLYTSRTPDGKKFAKAVFSLITNLDGTKTDYQYKLNLIQCYSLNGQTEKAQLVYDKIEAEGQKDGHWANVFLLRAYTNDGSLKSMANAEELMKKKSSGDTRAFAIGLMIQGYAKVCSTGESDPEIFKKFSKYLAELSGMGNAPNRDTLVAVSSVLAEEQINRTALFNKMYSKIASQADAKAMLRAYGTKLLSRNDLHGRGKDLNTIGLLVETIKQREDVDHENFLFFLKKYMHSSSPSKFQKLFNLLPMIARNDNRLKKTTLTAHMIRLEHLAMRGTPDGLAKALVETISTCGSDINEAQKSEIKRICTSRGLPSPY